VSTPGPGPKSVAHPKVNEKVTPRSRADDIRDLLDGPELGGFVKDLDDARECGRIGYGSRALVGMALVRPMYGLRTWTSTARLIAEHRDLQDALGGAPSHHAAYRFCKKLLRDGSSLAVCLDRVLASLQARCEEIGRHVALDCTDIKGWVNGQRDLWDGGPERTRFSDGDATWGHRSAVGTRKGGGFCGTASISSYAPPPASRSRGRFRQRRRTNLASSCHFWNGSFSVGSVRPRLQWTRATTFLASMRKRRP
jgi:hypothetical protein